MNNHPAPHSEDSCCPTRGRDAAINGNVPANQIQMCLVYTKGDEAPLVYRIYPAVNSYNQLLKSMMMMLSNWNKNGHEGDPGNLNKNQCRTQCVPKIHEDKCPSCMMCNSQLGGCTGATKLLSSGLGGSGTSGPGG